ncbi:MAG: hypothetical protein V4747_09775 [Pseudomonadota bacterium]
MFRVATLLAALSFAAPAHATVYDCKINADSGDQGWISKDYVFDHDSTANSVSVVDDVIRYFLKKPLAGKVSDDTSRKLVFSWTVQAKDDRGNLFAMQYRAAWFKGPKTMTVTAIPPGYANNFDARGTCTVK